MQFYGSLNVIAIETTSFATNFTLLAGNLNMVLYNNNKPLIIRKVIRITLKQCFVGTPIYAFVCYVDYWIKLVDIEYVFLVTKMYRVE